MSSTDEPAAKRKRTELDDESAAESDSKEQSSTATATAAEAATTVASGTTAESMKIDLDEWDGHLYPLIKLLKNKKGGEFEVSLCFHWLSIICACIAELNTCGMKSGFLRQYVFTYQPLS